MTTTIPPPKMNLPDLPPVPTAALTGFISGLVLCIPVGPVNLTIINEGARRGFGWASLIGLGAVVMETIYCALAFTGFASFFEQGVVKATMELVSFVFMLWLGLRFVMAKTIEKTNPVEERIEERLKPHTAFMIGFVRVMGNPGVLLGWILLAANFISREWVAPTWESKLACITGVALGVGAWFLALSYLVSFRQRRPSELTLLKLEKGSGVILLLAASLHGGQIIWQMAQHRIQMNHQGREVPATAPRAGSGVRLRTLPSGALDQNQTVGDEHSARPSHQPPERSPHVLARF